MFNGKIYMEYHRKFRILAILFLVVVVFTNSAMAEVCFCGSTCLHGFQPKSKINVIFHMRCPGTLCKSCDLEERLTLKATNRVTHSLELKSPNAVFIPSPVNDYPFTNDILTVFQFNPKFVTFPTLPLYLQNLTFLC